MATKPFSYAVIQEWVAQKMGTDGVTLPFLVGAIARRNKNESPSRADVDGLVNDIQANKEFSVFVKWCPVKKTAIFKESHTFAREAVREFEDSGFRYVDKNALTILRIDADDVKDIASGFAAKSYEPVLNKTYSWRDGKWDVFSEEELKFIDSVIDKCAPSASTTPPT